jgi:hypothetical protein
VRYNLFTVSIGVGDTVIFFSDLPNGAGTKQAVKGVDGGFESPDAPQRLLVKVNVGRAAQLDRPRTRFTLPARTPVCHVTLRVQPRFESQPTAPVEALRPLPRGPANANHEEEH